MSSTTDLALLQSSLNTLLRPLPPSSGLPPSLQHALSTSLSHDLRLKLAPGAMRQVVQQLEGLREVGMRRRERNRVREEGEEGAVRVRKGDGWVEELPREWAGAEGREKEKKRYAALLTRVRALKRQRNQAQRQLSHYDHLTTLLPSLSTSSITSHTLTDPSSALRTALEESSELLAGVTEEVEADSAELVALKREKQRGKVGQSQASATAGGTVVELLERP